MNAFGQVPVMQDGDVTLADSNAILVYLKARYAPMPTSGCRATRWPPRRVQRWFSVAAGPAGLRPGRRARDPAVQAAAESPEAIERAHALFAVMEQQLGQPAFLAGSTPTLADIANYSYLGPCARGQCLAGGLPAHARLAGPHRGPAAALCPWSGHR